jgi:membrane protease YdiL (CAAX protease family)
LRYLNLAILIVVFAGAAAMLELAFETGGGSLSIYRQRGAGLVILYLLGLLLLGVFVSMAAPIGFGSYAKLYWANKRTAAIGFLAVFLMASTALLVFYAVLASVGQLSWSAEAWQRVAPRLPTLLAVGLLSAWLVAISEEIVFRGVLLSYLRWNGSSAVTIAAITVSALLFAIAHNIRDPLAWLTPSEIPLFIGLVLLAVLLGVTYVVTRSLWCSIGLHSGLLAIGRVLPRGDMIVIDFEPWWLGGTGDFGMGGDLRRAPIVWAIFIAMTIVALAARRWLAERFAIEPFVGMPDDRDQPSARTLRLAS